MSYIHVRSWFAGRLVELAVPVTHLEHVSRHIGTYNWRGNVAGYWTQDTGVDGAAYELLALPGVFVAHRYPYQPMGIITAAQCESGRLLMQEGRF